MAQDTLVKFSNAIITDAEEKRREYIKKLEKDQKELIETKKEEFKEECEKQLHAERARLSASRGLEVSQRRNELKRDLIKKRSEMFDGVFAEITENIKAYADTEEYREKFAKLFAEAAAELLPGKLECSSRAKDAELFKAVKTDAEIEFVTDDKIIGGFTLKNTERHLFLDGTLNAKIEDQKEEFFVKSGLVIE